MGIKSFLNNKDVNIRMSADDGRFRYYQWLRSWFGIDEKIATHKCPFYQTMIWGTLLLVLFLPFFLFYKIIDMLLIKPLCMVWPDIGVHIERLKTLGGNIVVSIWVDSIVIFVGVIIAALFFNVGSIWYWFLWLGPCFITIFSLPWWGIYYLCIALKWFGINFVWAIGWLISAILAWPWLTVGYIFGSCFLLLLGTFVAVWMIYRLGIFLFDRGAFQTLIDTSCNIRETMAIKRMYYMKQIKSARDVKADARAIEKEFRRKEKERRLTEKEKRHRMEKFDAELTAIYEFFCFIDRGIRKVVSVIGMFFYTIFDIIFSTISNHCPPIDFLEPYEKTFETLSNVMLDNTQLKIDFDVVTLNPDDYKRIYIKASEFSRVLTTKKINYFVKHFSRATVIINGTLNKSLTEIKNAHLKNIYWDRSCNVIDEVESITIKYRRK